MKICFIDTLGLCYDGSTLSKRGLGGSESAIILIARQLQKIGFEVTVFNDCESDDTSPGIYDSVRYLPLNKVEDINENFDVTIASRSVCAFAPKEIRDRFKNFSGCLPNFETIMNNSKHKVLWMHDTFCDGDDLIEQFILEKRIDEIFTLSDWHTSYVTTCNHGKKRNFDIVKNHIFITRNGIGNMDKRFIDIKNKDPNLFVYNASVTKGMVPLCKDIWPRVKKMIPEAKLKVIGGYYRFRSSHGPDQQEQDWRQMVVDHPEINFLGVIPQKEISEILEQASYMIYPTKFPETYGISTLEALYHNVPIITCRFGALEETALEISCYKIPYSIEPDWANPWINKDYQVETFCDEVFNAWNDKYLHQQKMYSCNQIKDIATWDTVALQWKQHFYRILGKYLSVNEYRQVEKINNKVNKIFGRRYINKEHYREYKQQERPIRIITPVYNSENYIENCIKSVVSQDYNNWKMYIIDDCSTDNTVDVINKFTDSRITLIKNKENKGAVYNQIKTIEKYCDRGDIIFLLDGDDSLINNPGIFDMYNNLWNDGVLFSYGSCWSLADNIPLIAQPYPDHVKQTKLYKYYKFNWNMPYTHLRVIDYSLFSFDEEIYKDMDGNWMKAGGDTQVFYTCITNCPSDNIHCNSEIVYNYNDANPLNDYKVNSEYQTKTANYVMEKL